MLELKDSVISDSTYLFFAGLTLIALVWTEQRGWQKSRPLAAAGVTVLCMLLAYGSRSIGLALAAGFVLYQAIRVRRPTRFNVAVLAGFCAGVLLLMWTLYDSRSYANQFVFSPTTYVHNAVVYLKAPAALWKGCPTPLRYALTLLTMAIAALEFGRRLVSDRTVVEFYIAAAAATVVLYSAGNSDRHPSPWPGI